MRLAAPAALAALAACAWALAPHVAAAPALAVGEPKGGTPAWLLGVWTREWERDAQGQHDDAEVYYLQAPGYFADLRIQRNRPPAGDATAIAQLDVAGRDSLAGSLGFAGRTAYARGIMHWQHEFEFQPPDGTEDAGYARPAGPGRMRETGLDGSYVEAWRRLDDGGGRFLVLRAAGAGRERQLLVLAGDHYIYVRDREAPLPRAESMRALVAARPELAASAPDCEFSYGRIKGGEAPWQVRRSTLPWREGGTLPPALAGIAQSFMDGCSAPAGNRDGWRAVVDTYPRRAAACKAAP